MTGTNEPFFQTEKSSPLKAIIDAIPDAILIIGQSGLIVDCNNATLRIFGAASREEIIGCEPARLYPVNQTNGNDSRRESNRFFQTLQDQGSLSFFFDHATLSGHSFHAKVTLDTIRSDDGQYILYMITDYTGFVRVEEIDAMTRHNPYAILTLNPDHTIADVNSAFLGLSGYQREEWIGRALKEFTVVERNGPTIGEAIRKKETVTGNIVVDFPTGIKNLEYSYIPVFDADGNLVHIYDIFLDLTRLFEKIHESDSLIAQNPASILTMDPQGKILSVNPSFLDISHIPEDKLLSMNIQEFNILKREGTPLKEILVSKKTAKGKLVVDFGWAVKTLDFTYIPVTNANGDVVSLVAMYIDVSDQIAYIEEIETLIQENPHAILKMNPDMRFTDINPAFTKILGYSKEETLKMKLTDITVLERSGESFQDAIKNKKPARARIKIDCPAGIRHLEVVYIPVLDQKGEIIRFMEVFSDMTAVTAMVRYLEQSVEIVQKSIASLSRGDTTFKMAVLDADENSESAREQFVKISTALDEARGAIARVVDESEALARAAIAGDLTFRSDASLHEGDYRKVISGMNQTLDSIMIPIRESMRIAGEYADYNFAEQFDDRIDATGDWIRFKDALNNIGIRISAAISLINTNITSLATSAEEANASIEEVIAGSQQITRNAGKVSQNAEQGGDGMAQVLRAMEDLNETVASVSRKAESVSVASNEANDLAKGGIGLSRQSEKAMHDITGSTNEVGTIVSGINSRMDEIGKIVRLITDIANQTNLLALNAAIEAARAGEAGRGFAVVAAEVKSLAQDSRKSAEDIAEMIAALQQQAKQATDAMSRSTIAVTDGSRALEQTVAAFNQIAGTIEMINNNTMDVASASEEQAASVEEVTASIQEVSNLILSTSTEAGDAVAATEEASASVDEIGKIMGGIIEIVEKISSEMGKFKTT